MRPLATILGIVSLCVVPACALAAPATVNLRVEGSTSTIFEGPVTTDGKTIAGHPCDGTNGGANPSPGPTMTSALDDAAGTGAFTWSGTWFDGYEDFGVDRIGPDSQFWGYALNYEATAVGGCQQVVSAGDEVLFAYDFFGGPPDFAAKPLLKLTGPAVTHVGDSVGIQVVDGASGLPASGASVHGVSTGADGKATIPLAETGTVRLKATRSDAIRSNSLDVCVHLPGDGACQTVAPPVKDSSAPSALIAGLRNGSRLRRGPRVLRGTAADQGSGVAQIKLSLRRHGGGRCSWWSATAERFSGASCKRKVFFAIGDDASWSYQLAKALGPGHYVLDVKVRDKAGNVRSSFVRGQNRVVFDVVGGARQTARTSAAAARVEVMIVGKGERVLADARTVTARAVTVRASGRRCRVAASTPLAALVTVAGRLKLGINDYGTCSRRDARDSAQLFVRSIGGERNSDADGWVYKLREEVPSIGAADRLARVRSGNRLAWFYCVHASDGSCQETLELKAGDSGVSGSEQAVAAVAVDDRGRKRPAAGARVQIGPASAITGLDGVAHALLPAPGSYRVLASRAGTVPAFPSKIEVTSAP